MEVADAPVEPVEVEEVRFLTGFSVRWDRRPHRVRVLGVDAAAETPTVEVRGGSWADGDRAWDAARADIGVGSLSGRPAVSGVTVLPLTGGGGPGPRDRSRASGDDVIEVPLDGDDAAVFLTGFRFEVGPDHADGYTLHTLEVSVGAPEVVDGVARIPVRAELGGGPVPDRHQRLGRYDAEVEVSWLVVGCAPEEVQRGTVVSAERLGPAVGGRSGRAGAEVAGDLVVPPDAVVGLSGFRIDLDDGLLDGRYTRGLEVWLEPPADGVVPVRLGFDNEGWLARPVRVALAAEVTALSVGPTGSHDVRWLSVAAGR